MAVSPGFNDGYGRGQRPAARSDGAPGTCESLTCARASTATATARRRHASVTHVYRVQHRGRDGRFALEIGFGARTHRTLPRACRRHMRVLRARRDDVLGHAAGQRVCHPRLSCAAPRPRRPFWPRNWLRRPHSPHPPDAPWQSLATSTHPLWSYSGGAMYRWEWVTRALHPRSRAVALLYAHLPRPPQRGANDGGAAGWVVRWPFGAV